MNKIVDAPPRPKTKWQKWSWIVIVILAAVVLYLGEVLYFKPLPEEEDTTDASQSGAVIYQLEDWALLG